MTEAELQRWTEVFKGLSNKNRVKSLNILSETGWFSVGELSDKLDITIKNTSRNLAILRNLGILEYKGKNNRVFYRINPDLEKDIIKILKIVLK